jgi:prevent-host-death family protein
MYMIEDVYGIRELQRHLSRALKSVREGRRVVVTDDGTPVAVILPSSEAVRLEGPQERKIARLHREGTIVQLGRPGPRRRLRAWRLGTDWVRGFLEGRR